MSNSKSPWKKSVHGWEKYVPALPLQGYYYNQIHGLGGLRIGEFPWLVGRYCCYLLPKQAGATSQIQVHPAHVSDRMNNPVLICMVLPGSCQARFSYSY